MLNHVNEEKLTIKQLIRLICENPVKIFGIQNKGYIKENFDADLTLIDMNKVTIIDNKHIASKCGWTPFHGKKVKGFPIYTIINGSIKMKDGLILGEPTGRPILFS
jgi:dihydroorotase